MCSQHGQKKLGDDKQAVQTKIEKAEERANIAEARQTRAEERAAIVEQSIWNERKEVRDKERMKAARSETVRLSKQNQFVTTAQGQLTRTEAKYQAINNRIAEAEHSFKVLNATLQGVERSVNPLQSMSLTYEVSIPLDMPQLKDYKISLDNETVKYLAAIHEQKGKLPESSVFDGFKEIYYTGDNGKEVIRYSLKVRRGSILYPTDTETLLGEIFSYKVRMRFWNRSSETSKIANLTISPTTPLADIIISTIDNTQEPELLYEFGSKTLRLFYSNLLMYAAKFSDSISSIPDLDDAKVLLTREVFRQKGGVRSDVNPDDPRKNCSVSRVNLSVGGRAFDFQLRVCTKIR